METVSVTPIRGAKPGEGISFLYQLGRHNLIVDCGLAPNEKIAREELVDIYLNLDCWVDGILLTHSHYDHARAAVWVAKALQKPISCTEYTKVQIREWAVSDGIDFNAIKINVIAEGDILQFGEAKIRVIRWAHSTPDALGFDINIGNKHLAHLGDGKLTGFLAESFEDNLETMREIARTPVDLLTMDVLGIKREGYTKPEMPVVENIARTVLENAGKTIYIFMYSSNDDRILGVISTIYKWLEKPEYAAVEKDGIRFLFRGSAMYKAVERMAELNDLPYLEKHLNRRQAKTTVVFGTTGGDSSFDKRLVKFSQADGPRDEEFTALAPNDIVIYSAGFIPLINPIENDKKRQQEIQMFRDMKKLGATIYAPRGFDRFLGIEDIVVPGLFSVGGHEAQSGLMKVINSIEPQWLLPFHLQEGGYATLQQLTGERTIVLHPDNLETINLGRYK